MASIPLPPTYEEVCSKLERAGLIAQFPPMVARELRRADRLASRMLWPDRFPLPSNEDLADTLARMRLAHFDTLSLMGAL